MIFFDASFKSQTGIRCVAHLYALFITGLWRYSDPDVEVSDTTEDQLCYRCPQTKKIKAPIENRYTNNMSFTAIYISGNLISQELIEKLDDDSAIGQRPADFGLESGTRVRQEIARAWTDANDYWRIFKRKLEGLKDTERGTTETRSQWMIPLLSLLGYELNYVQQPETVNEKTYDISHRAANRDALPVMIVSAKDELDKKPEGISRYRMSPHALLQEYLNVTEHTYGLVTNGKLLRLLRDNGRITRLTYLEFNLEKIFEEDLYADFALLYRLLHVSRMPQSQPQVADSIIEKYYQQAVDAGTRIRSSLSKAVEAAIKVLANGLLQHPANDLLREQLQNGRMNSLDFYQAQLRLVYRLLFIMTIEERRLVYPEILDETQQKLGNIYYNHYSLQRLRNLAGKRQLVQGRQHHLYIQLWQNFRLFEQHKFASRLGLQALGSGLFEPGKLQPLDNCKMYNKDLLEALYHLSYFTDEESGQTIRVNYGALNVEEFGSVYEGLLEYEARVSEINGQWQFVFVKSDERSKSGSHYTPEELVQPLIKHSLEYLVEERIKEPKKFLTNEEIQKASSGGGGLEGAALLKLKVCDVACGSGHILLSAARRIALEVARKQFNEEQPSPAHLRWATRQVINHCIYGVDKNPLAVELCKVAMWLEAHNPGEPLNFLDHHIKCGDAIVGLAHKEELEKGIADEAFKTLPGDDKAIASSLLKRNKQERKQQQQTAFDFEEIANTELDAVIEQYQLFKNLPERTPEEVAKKEKQYQEYESDYHRIRMKQLADAQVAQFFITKTDGNKAYLLTDAEYRSLLRQVNKHMGVLQSNKLAKAETVAKEKSIFHWFLEFPEVFNEGGFDCILGNPPFLGGMKISTTYGYNYLTWLYFAFYPAKGTTDLVAYFFRRIFQVMKSKGFQSLISTNTIAQGDTREAALEFIINNYGQINFAIRSLKWPGLAAVEVSLVTVYKGIWNKLISLNGHSVNTISSFLDDQEISLSPVQLIRNRGRSFIGSYILGKGFVYDQEEALKIIRDNKEYSKVLFPFFNGDDLNNSPEAKTSRYVINFFDWDLENAKKFPICFNRIEKLVKPEREKVNRQNRKEKWWQYAERAPNLYNAIKDQEKCFAFALTGKNLAFSIVDANSVFSHATGIISSVSFLHFSYLQGSLHEVWAWKYCSSMGISLRYTPSTAFETFPIPINLNTDQELELKGKAYYEYRRQLMLAMQLGLTKTYNAFHAKEIQPGINTKELQELDKKAIEKQYGKEVWNLWNHLQKTENTCSIEEAIAGIVKLRELHVQMDNAVLDAYGWNDIALRHDFYEVDYLPENDRIRYTIHPDARKEVLKRLLELNHKIHEEEVKAGLWDKRGSTSKTVKKGMEGQKELF